MNFDGSFIVYSTDTFSEHYCQTRSSLPSSILMATFPMKAFSNIDNIDVML
jgi:diaminopimelate decarboxylase